MIAAGIIGWPVAHSKSPLIHRFWLAKLGIDGDYSRFAVAPENLGEAVRALPKLGLAGVNVTVPHKVAALEFIDSCDGWVKDAGALNCIVVGAHGLSGCNTDLPAIIECLAPYQEQLHHPVIIGAGGAARAALTAFIAPHVIMLNRTREKGERAFSDVGASGTVLPLDAKLGDDVSIVINASSMGMYGMPPLIIDLTCLSPSTVVFDMVYAPVETPLLAAARTCGLRTIDGLQMLIQQAAAAFELFYGQPAPREHDAELRALLTA